MYWSLTTYLVMDLSLDRCLSQRFSTSVWMCWYMNFVCVLGWGQIQEETHLIFFSFLFDKCLVFKSLFSKKYLLLHVYTCSILQPCFGERVMISLRITCLVCTCVLVPKMSEKPRVWCTCLKYLTWTKPTERLIKKSLCALFKLRYFK